MTKAGRRVGRDYQEVRFVEERGWSIFNGNLKGEEGEYTFTGGKECTVIDYVVGSRDARNRVRDLRVGDRVDSDHHLMIVTIWGKRGGKEQEGKIRGRRIGRGV